MFTGIVQHVGQISALERRRSSLRLSVSSQGWPHRPAPGDSISVSGCCLTLAQPAKISPAGQVLTFDVVAETLSKTILGSLKVGSRVNLEHALTPASLLGGHLVQGHVDTVAKVAHVQSTSDWRVWFTLPKPSGAADDFAQYLIPKGSICVSGVSLTIAGVGPPLGGPALQSRVRGAKGLASVDPKHPTESPRSFHVALIPTTLDQTTLRDLAVGDEVNIEVDHLVKTIVRTVKLLLPNLAASEPPAKPRSRPRSRSKPTPAKRR